MTLDTWKRNKYIIIDAHMNLNGVGCECTIITLSIVVGNKKYNLREITIKNNSHIDIHLKSLQL